MSPASAESEHRYPALDPRQVDRLRSKLVSWSSPRPPRLPWHYCADPYRVLVAEVLLRRSRGARRVYDAIVSEYPTPAAMAAASIEDVRRLIRPLGLLGRAETLRNAARRAVEEHGGLVPPDPDELRAWKGIGEYTANAVACLAFDAPCPMVDDAVGRLVRRFLGVNERGPAHLDRGLWAWVRSIMPRGGSRELNLALLHVSKEVCRPRRPRCDVCPLREECASAPELGSLDTDG